MLAPASVGVRRWHHWHEGSQIPHLLTLELRRSWQLDAGVGWYAPVGAPADREVVGWSRGGREEGRGDRVVGCRWLSCRRGGGGVVVGARPRDGAVN